MEDRAIPEIRIRKGSEDIPGGESNDRAGGTRASFEAMSDLEESDGIMSPDQDNAFGDDSSPGASDTDGSVKDHRPPRRPPSPSSARSPSPARPHRPPSPSRPPPATRSKSPGPARPPSPFASKGRPASPARPPPPRTGDRELSPTANLGIPGSAPSSEDEEVNVNHHAKTPTNEEDVWDDYTEEGKLKESSSGNWNHAEDKDEHSGYGSLNNDDGSDEEAHKAPRRPPPPSMASGGHVDVLPAPETATQGWTSFGEEESEESADSEEITTPTSQEHSAAPARPPPPKKAPQRPPAPRPGAAKHDESKPSAYDKYKSAKSAKKEKKHKKGKQKHVDPELISRFTKDKADGEKSSEYNAIQEMLNRTQNTLAQSQAKMQHLEETLTDTLETVKKVEDTSWEPIVLDNDPVSGSESEVELSRIMRSKSNQNKSDWIGFEEAGQLSSTTSTPPSEVAPSPVPLPPYNSRQGSRSGSRAGSRRSSIDELLDINLSADVLAELDDTIDQPEGPEVASGDLLGLGEFSISSITEQIEALSRNPPAEDDEEGRDESGTNSPLSFMYLKGDSDVLALGDESAEIDESDHQVQMDDFVDQFLGLNSEENKRALAQEAKQVDVEEGHEDEEYHGLGTGMAATSITTISEVPAVNGDATADQVKPEVTEETTKKKKKKKRKSKDGFSITIKPLDESSLAKDAAEDNEDHVEERPLTKGEELFGIVPNEESSETESDDVDDVLSPLSDDFDPRKDYGKLKVAPAIDDATSVWDSRHRPKTVYTSAMARKRPKIKKDLKDNPFRAASAPFSIQGPPKQEKKKHDKKKSNPFNAFQDKANDDGSLVSVDDSSESNPFSSHSKSNPFANEKPLVSDLPEGEEDTGLDAFGIEANKPAEGDFNPFATINDDEKDSGAKDDFDPFQTITGDDAFVAVDSSEELDEAAPVSSTNPFASAVAGEEADEDLDSSIVKPPIPYMDSLSSEEQEPLPPFYDKYEGDGWKLLLRQPLKKKLTSQRFWKPVWVRLDKSKKIPVIKVYANDKIQDSFFELPLQPSYRLHNLGVQLFDEFGKCHTCKIQYVFYRERVGFKADRLAPTISDLTRVRNLKGLKNLVHKPKATVVLDHHSQTSELIKLGSLDYNAFRTFVHEIEDAFFSLEVRRDRAYQYTKDEITMYVTDEYYGEVDLYGHINFQKARVRMFCKAFLSGMPTIEIGVNDKRREGKEIVARKDIIPIKTDEWIHIEEYEFHHCINKEHFEEHCTIRFMPLDASKFEVMRFRARPKINKELPLQVRVQMSVVNRRIEIRSDVLVPGYFSNSRRANQTPVEDIQVRIPIPEPWIYLFRIEKRFRYGSVKSTTRRPGKIKGLERLTQMAQGLLPASLIEVSAGAAKYEHLHQSVVWRIPRLPERNQGAYKEHLFKLSVELGPHDLIPESYEPYAWVEYEMPNSTCSRAQIRSISIENPDKDYEEIPDRWVRHVAKYEYRLEIEFPEENAEVAPERIEEKHSSDEESDEEEEAMEGKALSDPDSSSEDSEH